MQLVVAEKPSVARDLARVLGVRPSGKHCFEGDDRVITWCIGHLVELEEPAAYDGRWKAWRLDTLPMLPEVFRLRPAGHARDQLRAVTGLLAERRFTSVVNACDAGREGELIFRYVTEYAGRHPRVLRLWISSLTDDAIRRGFAALRPAAQLDALGDAARARSEADWLVGMNATRAITVRSRDGGHGALYSIGRVQTPTLAMLVHREQEIRAFVPRPYWEVRGEFTLPSGPAAAQRFTAGWRHAGKARLASAALAEVVVARDAACAAAVDPSGPRVERLRARTVREPPPLLFDLTALQRTANRRFGFSAARTLELAQALYERHKLLTYPRTDARHLSSDVARELGLVFDALAELPDYAAFVAPLIDKPPRPGRRVVDDAKVRDHHAIIPTPKPANLNALDRDERRLFDLVARRFLAAFYPDAEIAITDVWIRVGAATGDPPPAFDADPPPGASSAPPRPSGERETILERVPPPPDRYFARGRVRVVAGWQEVAGIDGAAPAPRDRDAADEPVAALPPLTEGQALDGRFASVAKQTTPPPRYTEATLLGAMEAAGQSIDDEALRLAMKDRGLGTPATRASIIETLLKREYIVRTKHLAPTALGISLIETLPVASLASPELTGTWEARLARIARGEESRDAFMADIARYVAETVDAVRGAAPPSVPPSTGSTDRAGYIDRAGYTARPGSEPTTDDDGDVRDGSPTTARGASHGRYPGRQRARNGDRRSREASVSPSRKLSPPSRSPRAGKRPGRANASRSGGPGSDTAAGRAPRPKAPGPRSTKWPRRRDVEPRAAARARDAEPRATAPARDAEPRATTRSRDAEPRSATRPRATPPASTAKPAALVEELACPRCRVGFLITGSRGWGCSRWRDGCGFVIWFETAGRRLSAAQLRDLVTRGKTRKARFRDERGSELDGRLVLAPDASGGARFEPS